MREAYDFGSFLLIDAAEDHMTNKRRVVARVG
jgi:hypothetical protein